MAAIHFRWLWVNCFVVKAAKVLVYFANMTRYNGSNAVVRTEYIKHGNSDVETLSSSTTDVDGIRVDFFKSWQLACPVHDTYGIILLYDAKKREIQAMGFEETVLTDAQLIVKTMRATSPTTPLPGLLG
ncbi:hypothetical protein H257_17949 [Aphanomyces astaci]|uniref:Uncharacterized protein n=1 Tax=Aphanomyces astaci TaxID=112090 RepID=W4FCS2_APHAT|nr:hypothetical protein H257_17949 [Aphanomyces astaci]ETV65297.1 hypothetical protein H257_17949 [Aphanomyces astaci]|eukprot:XP_009845223.1 hypothetical protein H257_17949 [Aphanomyces astaci]